MNSASSIARVQKPSRTSPIARHAEQVKILLMAHCHIVDYGHISIVHLWHSMEFIELLREYLIFGRNEMQRWRQTIVLVRKRCNCARREFIRARLSQMFGVQQKKKRTRPFVQCVYRKGVPSMHNNERRRATANPMHKNSDRIMISAHFCLFDDPMQLRRRGFSPGQCRLRPYRPTIPYTRWKWKGRGQGQGGGKIIDQKHV